jgi:hypothetical protein
MLAAEHWNMKRWPIEPVSANTENKQRRAGGIPVLNLDI